MKYITFNTSYRIITKKIHGNSLKLVYLLCEEIITMIFSLTYLGRPIEKIKFFSPIRKLPYINFEAKFMKSNKIKFHKNLKSVGYKLNCGI